MLHFPIVNNVALRVDSSTGPVVIDLAETQADQSVVSLLVLEANWSPAVFNSNARAWLLDLVARINAFLTQYLADRKGPQDQAALEAWLTENLSVDADGVVLSK